MENNKNMTLDDIIKAKLELDSNKIDKEKFYQMCALYLVQTQNSTPKHIYSVIGISKSTFNDNLNKSGYQQTMRDQYATMSKTEKDQFISLLKSNQRNVDKLRVANTKFRKQTRLTNALEDYTNSLIKVFGKHNLSKQTQYHSITRNAEQVVGILHLSDLHINEQINLRHNVFNVDVAAKRLQKHVDNAKKVFKSYNVDEVLVAFTGDLMNSDRRLDELLMNATNRANATFVAVDILQQVILDLNKDFNVRCSNVTGNESRVGKDIGWVNDIGQDNFDFMIYNTLAYVFNGSKGVTFLPPDDTFVEKVVNVAGQNILLIHGHNGFAHDTDRKVAAKFGQYAQQGIILKYVICGHIHSAVISDIHARSSGLPGSNNYSQNALNLTGKASQNIYIVNSNGDIHGMKIDLQDTTGYDGYNYKNLSVYDQR
jgi:predicted phosphodiesterase